jgi:hypothetical protein
MPLDGLAVAADYMSKALIDLMKGETPSCVDPWLFYIVCCSRFVEVFLLTTEFCPLILYTHHSLLVTDFSSL